MPNVKSIFKEPVGAEFITASHLLWEVFKKLRVVDGVPVADLVNKLEDPYKRYFKARVALNDEFKKRGFKIIVDFDGGQYSTDSFIKNHVTGIPGKYEFSVKNRSWEEFKAKGLYGGPESDIVRNWGKYWKNTMAYFESVNKHKQSQKPERVGDTGSYKWINLSGSPKKDFEGVDLELLTV